MGVLFGKPKKKESRITEQDKAVLQLKQQRDKLQQYQKKILISLENERQLAKQLLQNGKKEKAKLLLKKKRFMEQMLEKTDGQLVNLERMTHDLEYAQIEVQVIEGLKVGNEALKKIHEVLSIDEIERIMDETRESVEKQKEIDELLSGQLTEEDEDAVLAELEDIVAESLPKVPDELKEIQHEEVPQEIRLPDVPSEEPVKKVKRREEQLLAS